MMILDGQFEVKMDLKGPGMTAFDGQFRVIIQGHYFAKAIVSFFEDTWCLNKWHADSNLAPLVLGQHAYHH